MLAGKKVLAMPTYDYECKACGHRFEKFQSMTARKTRRCPKCKEGKVRRLIGSGGAILFKGSGFYSTDYRSDQYKKEATADKPPAPAKTDASDKPKPAKEKTD
jgi:putative FmdB family regulatory protein